MSQYPELIAQFSSGNQTRIKQGLIAKAPLEGWHYGTKEIVKKFHMYHRVAIEYSGGIYDIDNLRRAHLICMMKFITGDSDKYWDDLEEHLTRITQHPLMSDLIYYPAKKGDDEPENILKIVKEWRRSQGLPLFKDSK
ncbi:bacteriocin immunity protein [Escherichia coli]